MSAARSTEPSSKLPPDILIVQDASGSMNQDSMNDAASGGCGADSKWALMIPALNRSSCRPRPR